MPGAFVCVEDPLPVEPPPVEPLPVEPVLPLVEVPAGVEAAAAGAVEAAADGAVDAAAVVCVSGELPATTEESPLLDEPLQPAVTATTAAASAEVTIRKDFWGTPEVYGHPAAR